MEKSQAVIQAVISSIINRWVWQTFDVSAKTVGRCDTTAQNQGVLSQPGGCHLNNNYGDLLETMVTMVLF